MKALPTDTENSPHQGLLMKKLKACALGPEKLDTASANSQLCDLKEHLTSLCFQCIASAGEG